MNKKGFGKLNIVVCTVISAIMSTAFYFSAQYMNERSVDYTSTDTYAGTVFVFILAMIISISLVPPFIRVLTARSSKRSKEGT